MEQEGGEVICADAGVGFTCTAASGTACGFRMPAAVELTGHDRISTTLGGDYYVEHCSLVLLRASVHGV